MDFSKVSAPKSCNGPARSTSSAANDEFFSDLSEKIPDRLRGRLKDMQELTCYLLRKNEELRMEIFADRQRAFGSKSSAMSRGQIYLTVGAPEKTNPRGYEPTLRTPTAEQVEPV